MRCELEIIGAVARLLPVDAPAGAPYRLALTVVGDGGVATIKGLAGSVDTATRRAVFAALRAAGFHTVRWTRHAADGSEVREIRHRL